MGAVDADGLSTAAELGAGERGVHHQEVHFRGDPPVQNPGGAHNAAARIEVLAEDRGLTKHHILPVAGSVVGQHQHGELAQIVHAVHVVDRHLGGFVVVDGGVVELRSELISGVVAGATNDTNLEGGSIGNTRREAEESKRESHGKSLESSERTDSPEERSTCASTDRPGPDAGAGRWTSLGSQLLYPGHRASGRDNMRRRPKREGMTRSIGIEPAVPAHAADTSPRLTAWEPRSSARRPRCRRTRSLPGTPRWSC